MLGVGARRRLQAVENAESRREHILEHLRGGLPRREGELSEFVEIHGRRHRSVCGTYQLVEPMGGALVVYRKLEPLRDSCEFSDVGPFLILAERKGQRRWRITDNADNHKRGFARNEGGDGGCPTLLKTPWEVYDKEAGYQQDPNLKVAEIPMGFVPVLAPAHEKVEIDVEIVIGTAKHTMVIQAWTEQDESQLRRLEPRGNFILPDALGGKTFRGRAEMKRAGLLPEDEVDRIWTKIYQGICKVELLKRLDARYIWFTPQSPTVFYMREEFCGVDLADIPKSAPRLVDMIELDSIEATDTTPVSEPPSKRRCVDWQTDVDQEGLNAEMLYIGGEKDPFLWGQTRVPRDEESDARVASQTGPQARERSNIPESPIARFLRPLRRRCLKVKDRVLREAPFHLWYPQVMAGNTSFDVKDADQIWIWAVALAQDLESPPVSIKWLLSCVSRSTLQGTVARFKCTLARTLSFCDATATPEHGEQPEHCPTFVDVLDICIEFLSTAMSGEKGDNILFVIRVLGNKGFREKDARTLFNPKRKTSNEAHDSTLISLAFGIVISGHLRSTKAVDAVLSLVRQKVTQSFSPAAWCRIISMFTGIIWNLFNDAARSLSELELLARHAPSQTLSNEYTTLLQGFKVKLSSQPFLQPRFEVPSHPEQPGAQSDVGEIPMEIPVQPEPVSQVEVPASGHVVDDAAWVEGVVDNVVARLLGPTNETNTDALDELYSSLVPTLAGSTGRERLAKALSTALASASLNQVTWRFFKGAELFLGNAEQCAKAAVGDTGAQGELRNRQRNLILRAHFILEQISGIPGQDDCPKVAILLRVARAKEALDAHALQTGGVASRAEAVQRLLDESTRLLKRAGLKQRAFQRALQKSWAETGAQAAEELPASEAPVAAATLAPTHATKAVAERELLSAPKAPAPATAQAPAPARAPTPGPSLAASPSAPKPSYTRIRDVTVDDLRPGVSTPWQFNVFVKSMKPFASGSGFSAVMEDVLGKTIKAFFFYQVRAQAERARVRPGVRLRVVARSPQTSVRQGLQQFGGGPEIVVGGDAGLTTHILRLDRMPAERYVEVLACVRSVSGVQIARNGSPYRSLELFDETPVAAMWYIFGASAFEIAETWPRGTVVLIQGARAESRSGRCQHLMNGQATFLRPDGPTSEIEEVAERAADLRSLTGLASSA